MTSRLLAPFVLVVMSTAACTSARQVSTPSTRGSVPTTAVATTAPPSTCTDQHGSVTTQRLPHAGADVRVDVYLPPCGRPAGSARYPTVYLLHGGGTDETQWPAIGLATVADRLILAGEIPPIIVVMPSSGISAGDATVVGVVLPWADANLPTLATKADRAVGGISLGGGAALELVALHPDLFARVGGHSPAVHTSQKLLDGVAKWGGPVWFDVGQSDGLRPLTQMLAADLSARGDKPELQVWPGQHNRAYWGSHVADYLRFYTAGWKGAAAPSPGGAP